MDRALEKKITHLIGENLDRLVTIDWRCQGQIHSLFQAARDTSDGPLAMRAAQKFVDIIKHGDVVFVMTGFPVTPLDIGKGGRGTKEHTPEKNEVTPETDGVVAASLIARAVDLGFKAKPVIFCEEECVEIAKACCEAAGLRTVDELKTGQGMPHEVAVLPFTKDVHTAEEEARRILNDMNPKAAISVERPGKNEKGHYHRMDGHSVTHFVARIDELFEGVKKRGGLTIGIGDLGNELGMGFLKDATERIILYGDKCRCGCGGGIGTTSRADAIVFGAVSEDAAYAFLACLAHLLSQPEILHSTEMETQVLEAAYNRGAVDGLSGLKGPWIDYLDVRNHNHQIELMREIIECPMRFFEIIPSFYRCRSSP
jgi:hypothetical protein